MPFTPLHTGFAYLLYKLSRGKANLLAIIIGSMIIDIECPIVYILSGFSYTHSIMHSIIFGICVGTLLTTLTVIIVSRVNFLRGILEVFILIKDSSLDIVVASSVAGSASHLLLDIFTHFYGLPFLWPVVCMGITATTYETCIAVNVVSAILTLWLIIDILRGKLKTEA